MGIRQDDPLYPYLFLLCPKGLNRLLQKTAREDSLRGFPLCKTGPKVSNLFFAYDSMWFCRSNMSNLIIIQSILALYEQAFGQQLNRKKTAIFFSKSMEKDRKSSTYIYIYIYCIAHYLVCD